MSSDSPAQTVSVIVVTYNSRRTLSRCLRSVPSDVELVLVDQCSTDDSAALGTYLRSNAISIRAGSNRGFGAGCNLGAANASGDILIFLNPDAEFGSGSVEVLARAVTQNRALVGPSIVDPAGVDQTRARNWSRIGSDLAEVFMPNKLAAGPFSMDIPRGDARYRDGGRVSYVQGCCMAITAEQFWRAGGFDERFFLYYEEQTLATSLARIGVPAILQPAATVTHVGGASTGQARDFAAYQYYRSTTLFYRTYRSVPSAVASAVTLWVVLRLMALSTPVRRLIGLRADKGSSWYTAAAAGALCGLWGRMTGPPKPDAGSNE